MPISYTVPSGGVANPVVIVDGVSGTGDTVLDGLSATATFTPAASSHTAGDCVGAAQEFALAAPSACLFLITDVAIMISSANAMATSWRLELYSVTPPSATADDAAWDIPSGDRASYLGPVSLGTAVDKGSTQYLKTSGVNITVKLSGTSVFGYLINETTLTTEAVAHLVRISGTPV